MVHGWMEELVDTLLYLGIIIGLLIFSTCYWKEEYQLRWAEFVTEEFLYLASADGKIALEEYENYILQLNQVAEGYSAEVSCISYEMQPVYGVIKEEELNAYYMARNVRNEVLLENRNIVIIQEDAVGLKLQQEDNSTLLAAGEQGYLPVPESGIAKRVEAVCPKQEVYEGEALITLCRIITEEGSYYGVAESVVASESGTALLKLMTEDEVYMVPVEVVCYPRIVICENGHEVVNVKEKIEELNAYGSFSCPYCSAYPARLECSAGLLYHKTGGKIAKEELWLDVWYLDGHREIITPESLEWQDDYDENYAGLQPVTIRYRGMETIVTVISENGVCRQCKGSCQERCYKDYIEFPYCTRCMAKVPLFTGKVHYEEKITNMAQIIELLKENEEVLLKRKELIVVSLKKGNEYKSVIQRRAGNEGMKGGAE